MLPSYVQQVATPSLYDVGYEVQLEILDYLQSKDLPVVVLEAREVLLNPSKVLKTLCTQINIPFEDNMLHWKAEARPEDGSWAKYWYKSVHQSTGFARYKPKTAPFPEHLKPLLAECQPYYDKLYDLAIKS